MRMQFFHVPALAPEAAQTALDAFCAQHRVVTLEKHFVVQGDASYWAVCVTWVESAAGVAPTSGRRDKVDYREVLNEQDFAVFAELRNLRKMLAEREGVPAYALFTNEQLAEMVQRRVASAAALSEIEGVGKARVERHGAAFLSILTRQLQVPGKDAQRETPQD
ncbi:MAG: HRDC domain-containing protein [Rhodocyclaceae bacterium]|nr:HRDC domain-containing protein [Rhodocyclaceae bacterium]MBX3671233.1 HRDC domain-containing protein [Rhodocyclaceae bacterium]